MVGTNDDWCFVAISNALHAASAKQIAMALCVVVLRFIERVAVMAYGSM